MISLQARRSLIDRWTPAAPIPFESFDSGVGDDYRLLQAFLNACQTLESMEWLSHPNPSRPKLVPLTDVLTKEEVDFVERVVANPGAVLNKDTFDHGAIPWARPEELKLVVSVGAYAWIPTTRVILSVESPTPAVPFVHRVLGSADNMAVVLRTHNEPSQYLRRQHAYPNLIEHTETGLTFRYKYADPVHFKTEGQVTFDISTTNRPNHDNTTHP